MGESHESGSVRRVIERYCLVWVVCGDSQIGCDVNLIDCCETRVYGTEYRLPCSPPLARDIAVIRSEDVLW